MKSVDSPKLALMRFGVEYKFEISCRNLKFLVRPLANLEIIQATASAAEAFDKLPVTQRISISASLLNAMHQLEKASASDVGEQPVLTLAELQMMTPDEVNHLWKQYVRVTDKVNPSFEAMTVADLDAMVDDLKKSSDLRSRMTDLSISSLIEVCLHLLKAPPA